MTSLSLLSLCGSPTAKEMSDSRMTSAHLSIRCLPRANRSCVMAFGSPYLIERFPDVRTWLAEFSTNDVSQRAAVRALFGQVAMQGQIPVTVPGTVKRGDGLAVPANPMTLQPASAYVTDQLRPVFDLLDSSVTAGAFPGGVLAVGLHDQLVVRPFGKLTRDAKASPVTASTIYDMASLTKVDCHSTIRDDAGATEAP